MIRRLCLALLVALTISMPAASMGAVRVVDNGQLVGARGVIIEGVSFDVDFEDGTCADLYTGCDEESDFTFSWQEPATVLAARQALLAQVFVGQYDAEPELTHGCTNLDTCTVFFPIQKLGSPDGVGVAWIANNKDDEADVGTGSGGGSRIHDTSAVDYQTYARWSVSPPEPSPTPVPTFFGAHLALAAAIAGLSMRRLRRRSGEPTPR